MNFLYYKQFNEEKSSVSIGSSYKKKKDVKKKSRNAGAEGHAANCVCNLCNEHELRTHLLLDMSYSKYHANSTQKGKSSLVPSILAYFHFNKKDHPPSSRTGLEDRSQTNEECLHMKSNNMMRQTKEKSPPLGPVSLNTLKQDCFMIPITKLHNFFPAGHSIPKRDSSSLRMVEADGPDISIVFHLIGPAEPIHASFPSPLVDLHKFQKESLIKAFKTTVASVIIGTSFQAMVLLNLERNGEYGAVEYPFMLLWAIDKKNCNISKVISHIKQQTLECLDPATLGYKSNHYFDSFEEVATIASPPIDKLSRTTTTVTTGYIISVFKVFEGDDCTKFERNWLTWSGARSLYKSIRNEAKLRRITLHKSNSAKGTIHYILLCDCSNFLSSLSYAVEAIPRLRMRICGDTGLYRPICSV